MGELTLLTSISEVPGVGAARAKRLARLGLHRVGHLIAHLPLRHERVEAEAAISSLSDGQIVTARGTITAVRAVTRGRSPRVEAVMVDETGRLDLVWFNAMYMKDRVEVGRVARVQGRARARGPGLQVANPKFAYVEGSIPEAAAAIRPVYPAAEGISSSEIARVVRSVLDEALPLVEDHLDEAHRSARGLVPLAEAYRMQHDPRNEDEVARSRRRLAYDELLLLQVGVQLRRSQVVSTLRAPVLAWSEAIDRHIRERIPFALTPGQDAVVREIAVDLARSVPANRLIQGDVGSGKTVVALYAILLAVARGHQGALMAPTEILAEQHHESIGAMLKGSRVRVELLTGSTPRAERDAIVARLGAGEVDVLVGTHALLTETVRFASLAVAVVDEQHRFGVHQRSRLRTKGEDGVAPHTLVMTATPIPRSLAITLLGDMDVSTIRGLPPGRQAIRTMRFLPGDRGDAYAIVREHLDRGEQAYVVVPSIEQGDAEMESVRSVLSRLESKELVGRRVASMHGRLKRATRERIMERFRLGLIDALVATTVIEVGVDVPNASTMVVEGADRFGLAQLHQLRGRVGRGRAESVCLLISDAPTEDAEQRLETLVRVSDGFELAERDFELRGFGDVFGTRQSGLPPFRVVDLTKDMDLLRLAREDARAIVAKRPRLDDAEVALLRRRMIKAHGESLGLVDVG